jgi:DHA2 family multidrug resistance protein
MIKPQYFKTWILNWEWGIRIGLFLILLSALVQFGMFALSQNYMISYLGAQPEDISFALLLTYAGIISILPVQFRFLRYFETRAYLLANIILAMILNILCLNCNDLIFFYILRFLQGILVGNTAACILTLIFTRLQTERMQAIGSAVFYGTILGNTVGIGLVGAMVANATDWRQTYLILVLFQMLILFIVLSMLRGTNGVKKYPLFQIDWQGAVIFAFAAISFAYTIIYGSKYYWFGDQRIRYSCFIFICTLSLFIYRQLSIKRPLIHLSILTKKNVLIGLTLLAIYYGGKDTINLVYGYTTNVLKWDPFQVMLLGCCNVGAMIFSLTFSTRLMLDKRHSGRIYMIGGFLLMGIYNLWIYQIITPDLSFADLVIPVCLQGMASGMLFVPLIIFILSSAPPQTGTTGIVVAAYARFMSSLNAIAGFYNLQLYFNQYFKLGILANLVPENFKLDERLAQYKQLYIGKGFSPDQATALASTALGQRIGIQSQILTYRAVFMVIAIIMLIAMTLVFLVPMLNKTYLHWNRRMFTQPEKIK